MFKKMISMVLAIVMVLSMMVVTANAYSIRFSDVPEAFWGYTAIMEMAERGVFSGTVAPVNGVGKFEPNADMSRAAWVKTIVAYLYPDEVQPATAGVAWYGPYVAVAKAHSLINNGEIGTDMNAAMPRSEMAMVTVRAALAQGETVSQLVDINKIPDYNSIGSKYQEYVRQAVSLGLIAGVDTKGTFDGNGKLSRAAAATVAYRLMDKSARVEVEFAGSNEPANEETFAVPGEEGYASSFEIGKFASALDGKRKVFDGSDKGIMAIRQDLNDVTASLYLRLWFTGGIAMNPDDTKGIAEIVQNDEGNYGVRVFQWRKSYSENYYTSLNLVLEAFYYFTGDRTVSKALWNWIDGTSCGGSNNTDDYGFHDVQIFSDGGIVEMNGIQIEIHRLGDGNGNVIYFLPRQ